MFAACRPAEVVRLHATIGASFLVEDSKLQCVTHLTPLRTRIRGIKQRIASLAVPVAEFEAFDCLSVCVNQRQREVCSVLNQLARNNQRGLVFIDHVPGELRRLTGAHTSCVEKLCKRVKVLRQLFKQRLELSLVEKPLFLVVHFGSESGEVGNVFDRAALRSKMEHSAKNAQPLVGGRLDAISQSTLRLASESPVSSPSSKLSCRLVMPPASASGILFPTFPLSIQTRPCDSRHLRNWIEFVDWNLFRGKRTIKIET